MVVTSEFEYGLSLIILKTSDRHVNNTENFIFTTGLWFFRYTVRKSIFSPLNYNRVKSGTNLHIRSYKYTK